MICIRSRAYYSRRCKKGMPTNTDLLFEILLRVPANHLYERARLVCGRWYHIVHSHAFINAQMHGATYGLLLSPPTTENNALPLYVTADADGGVHTSELTYLFENGVLATCNGLILEMKEKGYHLPRLVIVNPATKQSFLLPPFPKGVSYHQYYCSFAYSAASLAYKVVTPTTICHGLPHLQTDYDLDVLTVGVDESWRHVEVHHLPDHVWRFCFHKAPFTSEGYLHWARGRYCVTMDVETEIITLSEAPYEYHELNYYYLSTGRCVSLLVACGDLSWEVWEMKAKTGEWRKALPIVDLGAEKFRIEQLVPEAGGVVEPLGWVKYPQVLAFRFGGIYFGRLFVLYNLDTHQLDHIELPHSYTLVYYKACPHKNNLIWLS